MVCEYSGPSTTFLGHPVIWLSST